MKRITFDHDTAAVMAGGMTSRELKGLASNAGVSRSRGDDKTDTALRIVEQDPAVAARVAEALGGVDADPLRERREVGRDEISLGEAARRARHPKMRRRLEELAEALPGPYEAEVSWEYGGGVSGNDDIGGDGYRPGLTSVTARRRDDPGWIFDKRIHVILTPHGGARMLEVDERSYGDKPRGAGMAWRLFKAAVERLPTA